MRCSGSAMIAAIRGRAGRTGRRAARVVPGRNGDALAAFSRMPAESAQPRGRAQLRRAHRLVAHAVIAALKLDEQIAAGMGLSQTDANISASPPVETWRAARHRARLRPFGQFDPLRIVGKEGKPSRSCFSWPRRLQGGHAPAAWGPSRSSSRCTRCLRHPTRRTPAVLDTSEGRSCQSHRRATRPVRDQSG